MPRTRDDQLEDRILAAAYQLWKKAGEKALTMRAVARAARTTTPTVYQRFRQKRDIFEWLRRRAQLNLFSAVESTESIDDFCERYLDFAVRHRNEYELIHADWAVRLAREESRPSFELLKRRLAERIGGAPGNHTSLALSLAALAHGTATLLLTRGISDRVSRDLRQACLTAFENLVACAPRPRNSNGMNRGRKPRAARKARTVEKTTAP